MLDLLVSGSTKPLTIFCHHDLRLPSFQNHEPNTLLYKLPSLWVSIITTENRLRHRLPAITKTYNPSPSLRGFLQLWPHLLNSLHWTFLTCLCWEFSCLFWDDADSKTRKDKKACMRSIAMTNKPQILVTKKMKIYYFPSQLNPNWGFLSAEWLFSK
jgi:hypothetical protein